MCIYEFWFWWYFILLFSENNETLECSSSVFWAALEDFLSPILLIILHPEMPHLPLSVWLFPCFLSSALVRAIIFFWGFSYALRKIRIHTGILIIALVHFPTITLPQKDEFLLGTWPVMDVVQIVTNTIT